MATYQQIQDFIKDKHGFTVKTCWIAHMKDNHGLKPIIAKNRNNPDEREEPCPPNKQPFIKEAFEHFSMI